MPDNNNQGANDIESNPLLHNNDHNETSMPSNQPLVLSKYLPAISVKTGVQVVMGMVGSLAMILYLKPSQKCVELETCGKWAADISAEAAPWVFFFSGGLDFGGMNCFFAGDSVPRFAEFLHAQNSLRAKAIKGALILGAAATQVVQDLLISLGTDALPWQTVLSVTGATPGALFATVKMAESDIPFWISKMKDVYSLSYHHIRRCFFPLTAPEQEQLRLINHYKEQQMLFIQRINANWSALLTRTQTLDIPSDIEPLAFLFNQEANSSPESCSDSMVHGIGSGLVKLIGTGVAISLLAPLVLNTYHLMQRYLPEYAALQFAATAALSIRIIYTITKFTVGGFESAFNGTYDLAHAKPIDWLLFQLQPTKTSLAVLFSLATAVLSYATISVLFENNYHGPQKDKLRWSTLFAIDFFHLMGLIHLYEMITHRVTKDPKAQFLFQLEQEITILKNLSLEKFIHYAEQLGDAPRQQYQIQSPPAVIPTEGAVVSENTNKKPSCCQFWGCLFNPKKQTHSSILPDHRSSTEEKRRQTLP